MTVTIRRFRPEDATDVAAVLRVAAPYWVFSAVALRWQAAHGAPAARHRMLLAEVDGEVVGVARTGLLHESAEPGLGYANLNVLPQRRGRGVGSALLAAAEERLRAIGVRVAYAKVTDDPAAVGFAERHGYRRGRATTHLRLDLATGALPAPPALPGVRIASAATLAGDPRPLYEADLDASRDEPGDVGMDATGYADWRTTYWDRPDLDRTLTTVAICDGVVAAFSFALTDGSIRFQSGMTGTRRAYRGRGLAGAVKRAALHRAAEAGFATALTSNDAGNEAMLAINRRLGYVPVAAEWRYRRTLFR
ncbi:GNAT family N-acetyltransferase [Micromonospora sagamiensis]|uniref:Acetyltransferase (GNAT) family protein n=1 Tax=Micromonospora sagamiensis TaxID=47875 RepID=A0A562WDI4_9ACTN|nr:GNAT family N-acetyltransferase [Micromonospora sagamiensis]TWJ28342.1 acetyltransferase (GNAT) family protein [Micromonospora sagamiensis]BCL12766.1 N-acetyltransferase [Micromonospora sagamiensis]